MKKIVGILGMAAVLASGAFAAEPTADFKIAEFTGDASLTWKADFKNTDAVEIGMANATNANLKLGFITAGDKATTGSGVWGELGIKFEDPLEWNFTKDSTTTPPPAPTFKAPAVSTAKIHFVDGDFSAALNILKPTLKAAGATAPSAIGSAAPAVADKDVTNLLAAGFSLETKLDEVFSLDITFMDKGFKPAKDQKFGLGFNAALLAIPNLTAKAGVAMNFETEATAFSAELGYNFDLGDGLYVTPGAGFVMSKLGSADADMAVEAGALFGWGAKGQKPEFEWINKASDKFNEGVSVAVQNNLKFKDTEINSTKLVAGIYDQSLLSLVGDAEEVGTLKLGAMYVMDLNSINNTSTLNNEIAFGARYDITFDPVTLHLGADLDMDMDQDVESKVKYLINAKLSAAVISNTDLWVEYNIGDKTASKKIDTNDITIGTKIHF